jgi:hypothetical protein
MAPPNFSYLRNSAESEKESNKPNNKPDYNPEPPGQNKSQERGSDCNDKHKREKNLMAFSVFVNVLPCEKGMGVYNALKLNIVPSSRVATFWARADVIRR